MLGLYVHVPFCTRKCAYCDFYSLPGRAGSITGYIEAVLQEAGANDELSFSTLYLGGGTPSLLGADGLKKLINGLRHVFDLSDVVEATMEVNPESTTAALLKTAKEAGINRLSIGVQSLSDRELEKAGRIHSAARAIEAVKLAVESGFKTSADLIIGLPGQEWSSLAKAIETLSALGVEHISAYCLSLEEGTPLAATPPADLPSCDTQADLYEQAGGLLDRLGFAHYEISNFAAPGHECQHNLNYWRGGEYLGLGPAAASHLSGKRFRNRPDLDAYLENPTGLVEQVEELDPRHKAAEEAMLRLRLLSEGLNTAGLTRRFGMEATRELTCKLTAMAASGQLISEGNTYRLPPHRALTSNPILASVL